MVSTKFVFTTLKCSTCTAISPAAEEVITKKACLYYAWNSLEKLRSKTCARKEEKFFPSGAFKRNFQWSVESYSGYLLFCFTLLRDWFSNLDHFFNKSDLKFKPITLCSLLFSCALDILLVLIGCYNFDFGFYNTQSKSSLRCSHMQEVEKGREIA